MTDKNKNTLNNDFSANNDFSLVEVFLQAKSTVLYLREFYTEIYVDNFPDPDERESLDNLLTYLKNAETADNYRYHIVLLKDNTNNSIIGGSIFNYFMEPNSGVIEFIAVKNNIQSRGVGTLIYDYIVKTMSADAQKLRQKKLDYIFCEIDSPEHSKTKIKKYLYFWRKLNYRRLDFNYVQPSLSALQEPVTGLWFIVSQQINCCKEIQGKVVIKVLSDYMRYAMQIDNPEENSIFQKMRQEILSKGLRLLPIV